MRVGESTPALVALVGTLFGLLATIKVLWWLLGLRWWCPLAGIGATFIFWMVAGVLQLSVNKRKDREMREL